MDQKSDQARTPFVIFAGQRLPVVGTVGDRIGRIYALPLAERIDRRMAARHRKLREAG